LFARLLRFLFLLLLLTATRQATAVSESRWIELDSDADTITYDLNTLQMIEPGKFTIINKTVDHPDVMRLKLAVLDTLRSYCTRPDGKYAPPVELFMLGKPDMPVEKIEVKTQQTAPGGEKFKNAIWKLPYRKLAFYPPTGPEEYISFFDCEGPAVESSDKEYTEMRSSIMNGIPRKEMYDCRHGVMGLFLHEDDPPSKSITSIHIRGGFFSAYLRLCQAITGEMPYFATE
jgi:hypothetical protein